MPRVVVGRDRGDGGVAYLGIVLLVAAVLAALMVTGIETKVAGRVNTAICNVIQKNCPVPKPTTPGGQVVVPTPASMSNSPAPSPSPTALDAKTKAALDYLRGFLGFVKQTGRDNGLPIQDSFYNVLHNLQGLTPQQLNQLLAQLSPDELKQLNDFLSKFQWLGFGVPRDAMYQDPKVTFSSLLLSEANPDQLARLLNAMPSLRPNPGDSEVQASKLTYAPDTAPLFGKGGPNIEDVIQGNLGDCWFLASLAAVVKTDPTFIQNHIHQNANGTYTVTLYENGQPVQVTVDPSLPSTNGSSQEYAKTPDNAWVAIYEKALAEQMGGYGPTESNTGKTGLDIITGKGASQSDPNGYLNGWVFGLGSTSLGDIKKNLDAGEAVVTGSTSGPSDKQVVEGHLYTVVGVNPNAHPPTITLRNPWGSWAPDNTPEFVTLTEDQWKANFDEVAGVHP